MAEIPGKPEATAPPGVVLAEHGPAVTLPLPGAIGRALAASRIVDAAPDPYQPGGWRLQARSKVGAVALRAPGAEPFILRIVPKVSVARLFFLLGYALNPAVHRDGAVDVAEHTEVLPALAHAYERALERALRQGVLQGYRHTEEAAFVVRGRIREADQIRRHHGRAFPAEVAFDEYGTDIAENRLLRAAIERMLRLPRVPPAVRRRLRHHRVRLSDAAPLVRGQELPRWRPSRLNSRYRPALRLAEMVLSGSSVEHLPGGVAVDGFFFDMNRVFEDFVCVALREALSAYGGRTHLQAHGVHLDEDGAVRMRPDLVWYGDTNQPLAVADAKYKAEKPVSFPEADLYQMLAYCTALDVREGHLVYAKGDAPYVSHRIRGARIVIHQHALDLDQSPDQLLTLVRALAHRMQSGAAGSFSLRGT